MSFVQSLRMRNLFPVNSDLGSAEIDLSGDDPMYEIINAYNQQKQHEQNTQRQRSGLHQVASAGLSRSNSNRNGMIHDDNTGQEPLKFGGVVGPVSNPGADILSRASANAERIWQDYKKPQVTAGQILADSGIKPNDQDPGMTAAIKGMDPATQKIAADIDARNRAAGVAERRLKLDEETADNKGWTTAVINDPVNPGKQISVQVHQDGRVRPIKLDDKNVGAISKPGSNSGKLTQPGNLDSIRSSAKQSLDAISQFLDDKDELTDAGKNISGGSAILNRIPFTEQRGQSNTLNRIKANQIISLISEMKAQSKTGATGFGALNMKELGVLEDAASQLDSFTDEASFKRELKRIKDRLSMIMQDDVSTMDTMKPVSSHTAPKAPDGFEYVRRPDNKGWTAVRKVGK